MGPGLAKDAVKCIVRCGTNKSFAPFCAAKPAVVVVKRHGLASVSQLRLGGAHPRVLRSVLVLLDRQGFHPDSGGIHLDRPRFLGLF